MTLENIYDTYISMMYGIAVKISPTEKEAEQILIITFKKLKKQDLSGQNSYSTCAMLIKLIMESASEQFKEIDFGQLNQFEETPLINRLFFQESSVEIYCAENGLTRTSLGEKIRAEMSQLKNLNQNRIRSKFIPE